MAFLSIPCFHYPIQLARNFYGPIGNDRGKSKFSIEIFPIFSKEGPCNSAFSTVPLVTFIQSCLQFCILSSLAWDYILNQVVEILHLYPKNAAKFLCNHKVMSLLDKGHLKTKQKLYFRRVMSCDRTKMRHVCGASKRVDPYWTLDLPWSQYLYLYDCNKQSSILYDKLTITLWDVNQGNRNLFVLISEQIISVKRIRGTCQLPLYQQLWKL